MTVQDLSQLYWLNREIENDQKRLDELEGKVGSTSTPSLSGMPHAKGEVSSKVEKLALEIVDLQAIIAAKQIQCIHERNKLERYIADIPDSLTRFIFTLRFISGLSWYQVAEHIGGGNTEDGVRQRCYRYLKQTPKEDDCGV